MGNKILGKRSRTFYRGFNPRQLEYLKDKFETFSVDKVIDKELFMKAYQIDQNIYKAFLIEADIEEGGTIDQYQFICTVSFLCNLSVEELASKFFNMLIAFNKSKNIKLADLLPFTKMCLQYNAYVDKRQLKDEVDKINKNKFSKYDFNNSKSIDQKQFKNICMKDQDYKNWLFNMGFITKNQMDHQDQIYDLVDSDVGEEVERQLQGTNPNTDRIKRGVENRQQDDQFHVEETVGQQYTPPARPWMKTANAYKQADFDKQKLLKGAPLQTMNLQYVLGYRSFDCRNNLKFDRQNRIVYHQASLGIVMKQKTGKKDGCQFQQTFFKQHKDDITCLDIVQNTVVTGQSGTKPMIVLWKSASKPGQNLNSQFIITKQLNNSVGSICLSRSQKFIAATCNNEDHKLVVFNIQELKELQTNLTSKKTGIVCSGPLTKSLVFDIKFAADQKSLVAATVKQILFITFEKGAVNSSRGQFGLFSPSMALCLLPLKTQLKAKKKDYMVSGMGNGSIYFWQKDQCSYAVVGHAGSVSAICNRSNINSFISGDKTGKIIIWNEKLQIQSQFTVPKTNSPSNMIVSLSQNIKGQLLIGTKASNIYLKKQDESIQKARVIMSGHNQGHLSGMVIHDKLPYLYTGGEDQRLMMWEYKQKKLLKQAKCPYKIRSLDLNSDNKRLIVGYTNGVIQCYNSQTLVAYQKLEYRKIKNPDQEVLNLVKFQHYGKYFIACYSYPKPKVIVFGISDKEILKIAEIQCSSKIISLDISKSRQNQPKFIRFNTQSKQFYFYQISKEKPTKLDAADKAYLKTDWPTHTLAFSPQTKGFITEQVLDQDIVCCARSIKYRNIFLIGDKYSKIKMFNYPTLNNNLYNKYEGHSNAVTAIAFNLDEDYIISIGGQQKSILIWKYDTSAANSDFLVNYLEQNIEKEEQCENATGERSGATDQFKGQIKPPSDFIANPKKDNKLPDQSLQIYHVFGIRNKYIKDQVRNQCKFTKKGDQILFPTACMAVKMNISNRQQQIFLQHKQDIVSFTVDKKRQLMATGQMAEKNLAEPLKKILSIYVWDIENKKVLQKLDGFHTIAIVLLQFSPSGKLLFTCGNDDKNTFAVYDWRSRSILYSGPISKGKVNGICWKSQTQFITCGNDHVKFWEQGKGRQGGFGNKKFESQVCCVTSKNIYITGGALGNIYNWIDNKAKEAKKAHTGKVQCLIQKDFFIYSGGDDGRILRWSKATNGQIDKNDLLIDSRNAFLNAKQMQIEEQEYGILSIDFKEEKSNEIIFVTKGCYAIHHSNGKFNIVTQGHYKGQLWGLAANSDKNTFVTAGDDQTIRAWDIKSRTEMKRIRMQTKIRAIDINNKGNLIVVADANAKIYLLNSQFKVLKQYKEGKPFENNSKKKDSALVQEIKFSPNGDMVAYGTHGISKDMQFLKVQNNTLQKLKVSPCGSSALLHIDWSQDGSCISVNTQAHQLLFISSNPSNKKSVNASDVRNQKWATWTQKFGFPVQGIFQGVDYTDVNTVCRDPNRSFVAVGYDDQMIRIFKYPCVTSKQVFKAYTGHSSHITRIKFCPEYMISLGGEDKTIIVWSVDGRVKKQSEDNGEQSDGLDDLDEDVDIPNRIIERRKKKPKIQQFYSVEDQGDQFMAVKPWLGAIKEPTYEYPKQSQQAPKINLQLEYVHGYRVKDCRQNLYFADQKTLIFHAAAVLIYHDTATNKQTLFTDHNDDILSIDFHRQSGGVLTGELGPKPIINYYRNAQLIFSYIAPVTKGVLSVAISPDGKRGVCVGMDDDHEVALLDLTEKKVLSKKKGGKKVILKLGWVNDNQFVSVGINHFRIWTIQKNNLTCKQSSQKGNYVSLAIGDGMILTGGSGGKIYQWKQTNRKQVATLLKPQKILNSEGEQAAAIPTSVVQSVIIRQGIIAAGTKDGYIFILDKSFKAINTYTLNDMIIDAPKSENTSVRSIDFYKNKMLIGTFGSEIYQFQTQNLSKSNCKIKNCINHLKCHYSPNNSWTNEVWGLTITGDFIFSCSDDATVRCWSLSSRKLLSCASLNVLQDPKNKNQFINQPKDKKTNDFVQGSKGRSVGVSPDLRFVVVGCKDGRVRIFNFNKKSFQMKIKLTFKHAKQWISDIKFGYNMLLIGSHDNAIYAYDYDSQVNAGQQKFKRKYRPMQKHSSYITHIDISRDSCYMQSTCGAYELLFWDLNTGKQITSGATLLRDERWASWTCNLGWPVQGIYPKCTDGTFIHSVDRSTLSIKNTHCEDDANSPYLLAAGNNNGKVCVYNYPCTIKNSQVVEGKGHSSHITNVRWNQNDEYIVSVGGEDQCLMYWRVTKNKKN